MESLNLAGRKALVIGVANTDSLAWWAAKHFRSTLLTLAKFPVLVWMYVRLARDEERDTIAVFGDAYVRYATAVPGFIPTFRTPARGAGT